MYYDKDVKPPIIRSPDPEDHRVLTWQRDVARSTASEASRLAVQPMPAERVPTQIVVNQIVQPAIVVTRVKPEEPKSTDEINTRAIVGTLLGATAGAVVAYAMTKGESQSYQQPPVQRKISYRTIEAPAAQILAPPDFMTRNACLADSKVVIRNIPVESPHSRVHTLPPPSERSRRSSHTVVRSADAGSVIQTNHGTKISVGGPQASRVSHTSSSSKTVRQPEHGPQPPTVITVKSARDIPLPASTISRGWEDPGIDDRSIHPHDSVSQVSTKRSGKSIHHHGGSRTGSEKGHRHRSEKGSNAGSKRESSSKISGVRSPGMKGALGF